MKHSKELRKAIYAKNPTLLTIKETDKYLRVYAPNYSSHSDFLDVAFEVARSLNIAYKGRGHSWNQVYTVTFKPTPQTP